MSNKKSNSENDKLTIVSSTPMTGEVIEFYPEKEYGFIEPDDNSPNMYFPLSELKKIGKNSITIGQRVKYQLAEKNNLTFAFNIELI